MERVVLDLEELFLFTDGGTQKNVNLKITK